MPSLSGRRILITRSRHQASELAARLELLGAETILIPTIEIAPPASFAGLDDAIRNLNHFDWLVFTSANAVEIFGRRLAEQGRPNPPNLSIAAIGPATARAAANIGLRITLVPESAVAEALSAALLLNIAPKSRVLLVRAAVARDHLPETLRTAGAEVTIVEAYQTRMPASSLSAVQQIFNDPELHPYAITFASSSSVTNFFTLLQSAGIRLPPSIVRASIGPITSRTLHDHGFPPHLQAREASIQSLADALAELTLNEGLRA